MVNEILTGAGFILNQTYKETRFLKTPNKTFAVYHDAMEARGADGLNLLEEHDVTIELYMQAPDAGAEKRIEQQLDAKGIQYDKQPRYWLQTEGLYQVIYEFGYILKGAKKNA